jgi:hypothetical protein
MERQAATAPTSDHLRPKDRALGEFCLAAATGARKALDWIGDNGKRVGPARAGLERALKRAVVEANRLATAAVRPMSAAVFGPSQAGKSFLIGKFITPEGQAAKVVFGADGERTTLDFLTEVNPQGGKETTGLVTRFSLTPHPTPSGFPVELRLLREVDLIKILANSFLFDLSGTYTPRDPLSVAWVDALADELERSAVSESASQPAGLRLEDVLELREYFHENLPSHPYLQLPELSEAYWPAIERLLPRLTGGARVRALSPLWGCLPEFDGLFAELKGALDQLGHAQVAFAPLSAVRDTAKGVLHVDRIYELSRSDGPGAQMVALATPGGGRAELRKSVITALTSELRVTLDRAPWPFLHHTDLLDFPGARSREDSTPEKYLRGGGGGGDDRPAREYCFLRGKVAVLFDNYVADLDLNTMLLCVPDGNLETRKLPALVEGWVAKTHGATAKDRADRAASLMFCMTKTDRLFDLAAGATLAQSVENRLDVNMKEFAGWMREWRPGEPFNQTFLLRNPKAVEQRSLFSYEGAAADGVVRPEADLTEDFRARVLPALRAAFRAAPLASAHIADIDRKIDALMKLNDGGVSALAEALEPVSAPDLKYHQIKPRADKTAGDIAAMLRVYYEDDDIQRRLELRLARAKDAIRVMATGGTPLGLLLRTLSVEESALRQAYYDFVRRESFSSASGGGAAAEPAAVFVDDGGFGFDLAELGMDAPSSAAAPASAPALRETYGGAAVARWLSGVLERASDPSAVSRCGLSSAHYQVFVDELENGARRLRLVEKIDAEVGRILSYRQAPAATAATVALSASLLINDFISDAGRRLTGEGPDAEQAARARAAFPPPPPLPWGALPKLPPDDAGLRAWRGQFPTAWAKSFLALTQENASSADGVLVDPAQNARLGAILAQLSGG